jgi:hypothetical protein
MKPPKNYDHLVGRTAKYRRNFQDTEQEGRIIEITPEYSLSETKFVATMENGSSVDLNRCYFSEPIF